MNIIIYSILLKCVFCLGYDIGPIRKYNYKLKPNLEHKEIGLHNIPEANKKPFLLGGTKLKLSANETEYFAQVVDNGVKKINYIARYLQRKLDLDDDLTYVIKRAVKSYSNRFNFYVSYSLMKDEIKSEIDREYFFLDLVTLSNMIMNSDAKMLLNTAVEKKSGNISNAQIKILTERLYQDKLDHMREEMNFLCEKLNICKPYPGFSEHFAELVNEILKLSDDKLTHLIERIKIKLRRKSKFIKSFIKEYVAVMIGVEFKVLSSHLNIVKEFLTGVKFTIALRYKLVKTVEPELKMKTKAIRLLLDVIDKAFDLENNDLTTITFDATVKAIRAWQMEMRGDIDTASNLFFEHVFGVLKNNWNLRTREEVMTLTEVIMLGKSDDALLLDIFANGCALMKTSSNSFN